ncbi:MAG: GNAT family N-acetyltransferase [Maritimibacter sp.]
MSLRIRPLLPADRTDWEALWQGYLTFYESSVADEITARTFARLTDPDHKTRAAFVAEVDGRLVGFTHYIFHEHNWHIEDVTYLQDLFVLPDVRGTGAGRALIEAVYEAADQNGTPTVYWMTQAFNTTARTLYDQVATLTPFIKYARS